MKIAVIVYDLTIDYNILVLQGITSFFEDKKDVSLVIAPVNVLNYESDSYEFQYWSSASLLASKDIDAYIIIPNSFGQYISFKDLAESLRAYSNRPVFTVGTPLDFPDNYYTFNACTEAYENITEHLVKKHNCKNIAFFSADLVNSEESKDRFKAFKKGLKKVGVEFNPKLLFKGDFTPGTACDVLLKKYKTKEDIDFDAIVCVNDYTAAGCLLAFMKLQVESPADVILIGFDNTDISYATYPTLTTIDQYITYSGKQIAETAYKVLSGKKCCRKISTQTVPLYRQSCGCVNSKVHSSSYYDKDGSFYENDRNHQVKEYEMYTNYYGNLSGIYKLLNRFDANVSLEDTQKKIIPSLETAHVSIMALCFYDEPINVSEESPFYVPEKVTLDTFYEERNGKIEQVEFEEKKTFNPRKILLPVDSGISEGGYFFLLPIFLQEQNYGYMICKFHDRNYTLISIYYKILSSIIIQSYEYSREKKKQEELENRTQQLNIQTKTDELTQVFNRRGFLDYGQRLIDLSTSTGTNGYVFFCDMDGLKIINDTYGHKIGDLAIKTGAEALKQAFHIADLVGRLSGDEFAVVAPGFRIDKEKDLRGRVHNCCERLSVEAGLPFTVSFSMGLVRFNTENKDLATLLIDADKKLYEEKKLKHAQRGIV